MEIMQWGYIIRDGGKKTLPLLLPIKSHCHALVTGSSGSGKSYALLYLLGNLLQNIKEINVYFCDFKNSLDFSFLEGYPHYYSGDDCYEGVMEYYKSFCETRNTRETVKRYVLVFDEYPACINYFSIKDKQDKTKKSGEIIGAIAEILMLGRGIGYGVWIVTQRPDAALFANGARDNFMIVLGLGRMSKEQKSMIFPGEEITNKVYHQGEGHILADGHPLYEIAFPRISNIVDWKNHIKRILMRSI